MFPTVLTCLAFLLLGPTHATSNNWLFKDQPKDGIEHYATQRQENESMSMRRSLLENCDKFMLETASGSQDNRNDSIGILIRNLCSCGIIYGADHQTLKSKTCLDKARAITEKSGDKSEEARISNNLGIVHALWGKLAEALDYHQQALVLAKANQDAINQITALNQIGHIGMFQGKYFEASEALKESLRLSKHTDDEQMCLALDNIGMLNEAWGDFAGAEEYLHQSLDLKRKLKMSGGEIATLMMLGRIHSRRGDYEKAFAVLQEARRLCELHGMPSDHILDQIGNMYLDRRDSHSAQDLIKKSGFWQSLGRLFLMQDNLIAAEEQYGKLRKYAETRQIPDYLFVAYTGLGSIKEQTGDLNRAAEYYQRAVDIVEDMRIGLTSSQRSEFFNAQLGGFTRTVPHKGLARVLMKLNRNEESLRISELTKARVFCETIASRSSGIPPDIAAKETELHNQAAALQQSLAMALDAGDSDAVSTLQTASRDLRIKLQEHIESLKKTLPVYAATRYPLALDLQDFAIKEDEWILVYNVTDSGLLAYLLRGRNLIGAKILSTTEEEIASEVSSIRDSLAMDSEELISKKLTEFDLNRLKSFSDLLLRPFIDQIPLGAKLLIVLDGALGTLPFEMLTLDDSGRIVSGEKYPRVVDVKFLGDRNPISYYHSITALTLMRMVPEEKKPEVRTLAVVDPVFSADDSRLSGKDLVEVSNNGNLVLQSINKNMGLTFSRLPWTGDLGRNLQSSDPNSVELFSGLEARKNILLKRDLTGYRNIVLATHGFFDDKLPLFREPVLVLTLFDEENDSGFLKASEVIGLKLKADSVALTACQTGLGKYVSGEGVMGLGRAFQHAGAKTVITSLWSVAELPSVQLIGSYFRHVKSGKSKSESLQSARNDLRKQGYDHPFFWASFILVGETD